MAGKRDGCSEEEIREEMEVVDIVARGEVERFNKGSDGHATIAHGNSLRLVSGYQEATTRHSYRIAIFCRVQNRQK